MIIFELLPTHARNKLPKLGLNQLCPIGVEKLTIKAHYKNICTRFLHPESRLPYFKFGRKGAIAEGKAVRTNGMAFSALNEIGQHFATIVEVS